MFLGEYQHSLDAKGRVILPSKFRARLDRGCVIARHRDGCLAVYPIEEFENIADRLGDMDMSSQQARDTSRVVFAGASEQTPDSQARVTIPEPLRRYAELERDVMVAGGGKRFEIWDLTKWQTRMQQAEREFAEVVDATPGLPL